MQIDRQKYPFVGTTILSGSMTATTSAAQLVDTATQVSEVEITAHIDNTDNVYIGNASSQIRLLEPGERVSIKINDLSKVYVVAAVDTQTVTYLGLL